MWLIRIPPASAALIVGPITDVAASVLGTHFTATHRWSSPVLGNDWEAQTDLAGGAGVVIVTEPWPAILSPWRVQALDKIVRALRQDGCLLLLTDEAIIETNQGPKAEEALRSLGCSRVQAYLVEPAHATPRSIVPLSPAAVAHSRAASGGLIRVRYRNLKDRLLGKQAPRCIGLTAYR